MSSAAVLKLKKFFGKTLHLLSSLLLFATVILIVLTVLSRLGVLSVAGVAIVVSDSMEPAIRRFNLVVYASTNYTAGDVVVYCPTPSHCYVHRVVGFISLDTVNGNMVRVVTKGDNANETDSPVDPAWVRGRILLVVPREVWVPVALALVAYILIGLARYPVVGLSHVLVFAVGLASAVSVYALVPQPLPHRAVEVYAVHLAGVYLDPLTCAVTVRYTGELSPTSARVLVDSKPVERVMLGDREISFAPDTGLLGEAFETGAPLTVEVNATLNHAVRLSGVYELRVGGLNPEVSPFNGVLLFRNPNCFPVRVHVSIRYFDGEWKWSNTTHLVEGFSYLVVEPPEGARYAYAYVYWFNQGEKRWVGLPLRNW